MLRLLRRLVLSGLGQMVETFLDMCRICSECSDLVSDLGIEESTTAYLVLVICHQVEGGELNQKAPDRVSPLYSGPGITEYFSIKSAVCHSRTLRRASSSFVPRYLSTACRNLGSSRVFMNLWVGNIHLSVLDVVGFCGETFYFILNIVTFRSTASVSLSVLSD
ncbi:hypothetical protein Tco_1354643 [Tanacetum coccineum]